MNRFDNVKLVFVDKENYYLVGERFGTSHKYSLLGGHVEQGEKHWFTTASRELEEETNEVFLIEYRNRKYELVIADLYTMPMSQPEFLFSRYQLYVVFKVDGYFQDYIDDLRIRFGKNQDEYLFYILFLLNDTFPQISISTWMKIYDEYTLSKRNNPKLNKMLQDLHLDSREIKFIYKYFDKLTARMEMDNINIARLSELKSSRGLYQRDILSEL
jgi:8-oxo-dGTP pyrophosphatase MutT (NUDIX family)